MFVKFIIFNLAFTDSKEKDLNSVYFF